MAAIDDVEIPTLLFAEQGSDPSTPASGFGRLYVKSTGLFFRGDGGTVIGPIDPTAYAPLASPTFTGLPNGPQWKSTGVTGANTTPLTISGANASGAPGSGAHVKGEIAGDDTGKLWYCTVAGTPGTWVQIGASGSVSDAAYGVGWDGDTTTAPSKNAVYDKIQAMGTGVAFAGQGCSLTKSAVQSIGTGGTFVAVTFDGETFDDAAFHDNSTNPARITIPSGYAGRYLFGGLVDFDSLADQKHGQVLLRKNGTTTFVRAITMASAANDDVAPFVSALIDMSVGDYVELGAAHTDSSSRNIRASGSTGSATFWCTKLT